MKTRLTTKGFAPYLEAVAKAGRDVDAVSDEALAAGGAVLLAGMTRRVPVDTGNLKDNLSCTDPVKDGNFHFVEVGINKGVDSKTARYANVQEFGSSDIAAHPYIRPALDEDMGKARAAMRKVFEQSGLI